MSSATVAELVDLDVIQLDALREIANIGAGHAATALSQMTSRTVYISVTTVAVAGGQAIAGLLGDGSEAAILLRLSAGGSFAAGLVIVFTARHARQLAELLLGRPSPDEWLDPLAESALKETGNVLGAAYLNALARVTGWSIPLSTPELLCARADSADAVTGDHAGQQALCLETRLSVAGADLTVRGHVLLFPRSGMLSDVLTAIGLPRAR